MNTEMKNAMAKVLELAEKYGANAGDVILSKGESFSLNAQEGEIDKYQVSGSQVIGLRVMKDQKIGLAYSESLDSDALDLIAKAAVENAGHSEINEFEKIMIKEGEHLFPAEFKADTSSTEEKIDFCLQLESEVKKRDSRVQSVPYNGLSEATASQYYLNSNGVFGFQSEYYQSCYTSALLKEGDESSMHYHTSLGRNLASLNLNECVEESLLHAGQWLMAKPLATAKYDVIFTVDAFSDVFGCFTNILSGKGAVEKMNPFADRLGAQVASEEFVLRDIPQYADAFFKHFVDSEGVLQNDLTLIENGVLKTFYHNTATANYFGVKTTGHGARGAKSPLAVKGTTRVISAGKTSHKDITSGEYFEIHSLQGLHSGANAISGDFSFGASGYLCRDGVRTKPVKGVTVSGNFHQMLFDLKLIGDKVLSTNEKDFFAPYLRFEQMSIAG